MDYVQYSLKLNNYSIFFGNVFLQLSTKEGELQQLQQRLPDSDGGEEIPDSAEVKLKQLELQTPLIETLQQELSSAQVGVNTLVDICFYTSKYCKMTS